MASDFGGDRRDLQHLLRKTDACVPLERLSATLSASDASHVATCERCRAELRLWEAFVDDSPGSDEAVIRAMADELRRSAGMASMTGRAGPSAETAATGHRLTLSRFPGHWLQWAAAIALAVGLAYSFGDRRSDLVGPSETPQVYRSDVVDVLGPSGELTEPPAVFEWRPVPGAVRYDVTVREVDGAELWTGASVDPRLAIPQAFAALLAPGKTVTWTVTAVAQDGKEIGRSAATRFRVMIRAPSTGD